MRRIAIYSFFDRSGIVDKYVYFYLAELAKCVERIIIVSNGEVRPEDRAKLEGFGYEVIERPNVGFDIWGYKTGMECVGWESLAEFDEVILTNNSVFGPVYPFAEAFRTMDQRDVDFWGMTSHDAIAIDRYGLNPYGHIPEHIQSWFVVFRQRFVASADLQTYWNELPPLNTYESAVATHETVFTRHFADLGYRWDVFVRPKPEDKLAPYTLMYQPKMLLEKYRCPVFKRRMFFQERDEVLQHTAGEAPLELIEYVRDHTDYDLDMVWENLIRTVDHCDYIHTIGLIFTFPEDGAPPTPPSGIEQLKVALCMHLYFDDLLAESVQLAANIPATADVYITTPRPELVGAVEAAFADLPNKVEVRLVENRGRDVSGLLVGCADIQDKYDLICFYHDKKTSYLKPPTIGRGFAFKTARNTLASADFVANVINAFAENPRLGLLCPPEPNHGELVNVIGSEWSLDFEPAKQLADRIGLKVPMSHAKPPVAPIGGTFWYRTAAMKALFEQAWKYEDFPADHSVTDGTILHAIERLWPFIVQNAGYFNGLVMSDKSAVIEYLNLRHYLANFTRALADNDALVYGSFPDTEMFKWLVSGGGSIIDSARYLIKVRASRRESKGLYKLLSASYYRVRATYHRLLRRR